MKCLRWACILLFVLAASINVYGNGLRMRLYTTDDGLSNSNVSDIVQDRNGFVWIATSNGLNRFDGSNFKTILQGNQIRCIPSIFTFLIVRLSIAPLSHSGCLFGILDPVHHSYDIVKVCNETGRFLV